MTPLAAAEKVYSGDNWLFSEERCELDLAIQAKSKSLETILTVSSSPPKVWTNSLSTPLIVT